VTSILRVFVSHSSRDRAFVEQELIPLLTAHGVRTWYSTDEIQTAEDWASRIQGGLTDCDWFLVVVTPRSAASVWVRKEVEWAMANRPGRVIPVLLTKCARERIHGQLPAIQHVDYRWGIKRARRRLLETWKLSPTRTSSWSWVGRTLAPVLRGKYWRMRRVLVLTGAAATILIVLGVAAVLSLQDPPLRAISAGIPTGMCRAESEGSAIQLFERGFLVARFSTGQFYAIHEEQDDERIAWRSYVDDYKNGPTADCSAVADAAKLVAGFRKLYCAGDPELARLLGRPLTPEIKAYVQFQPWSHGLLMLVPSNIYGMYPDSLEHQFVARTAAFLEGEAASGLGVGAYRTWTETNRAANSCRAVWFRVENGAESPLIAARCPEHSIVHAIHYIEGGLACERF
jgi:hypothetical protein